MEAASIEELLVIRSNPHEDNRGKFTRIFDATKFPAIKGSEIQVNISENPNVGTLRGMHFQIFNRDEHKAISLLTGSAFIAIVDLREESKSYKRLYFREFHSTENETIFVPAGCATGWLTLQKNTIFHYLMYSRFENNSYGGFKYDDPAFEIPWPSKPKVISEQDLNWKSFLSA